MGEQARATWWWSIGESGIAPRPHERFDSHQLPNGACALDHGGNGSSDLLGLADFDLYRHASSVDKRWLPSCGRSLSHMAMSGIIKDLGGIRLARVSRCQVLRARVRLPAPPGAEWAWRRPLAATAAAGLASFRVIPAVVTARSVMEPK